MDLDILKNAHLLLGIAVILCTVLWKVFAVGRDVDDLKHAKTRVEQNLDAKESAIQNKRERIVALEAEQLVVRKDLGRLEVESKASIADIKDELRKMEDRHNAALEKMEGRITQQIREQAEVQRTQFDQLCDSIREMSKRTPDR